MDVQYSTSQEHLKRVFIWNNSRSLGTVFLKSLSQIADVKIINGLYTSCFLFGPEATFPKGVQEFQDGHDMNANDDVAPEFTDIYDASKDTCKYSWAKAQLQESYPGYKYLICKEAGFSICGNYDLIPQGFCHTFLIRHPYRMWASWKKNFSSYYPESNTKIAVQKYFNGYYNFKELYDLIVYLMNNSPGKPTTTKFNPIIIDADDLQNHPEAVLQQYCKAIGVPYTDDLLRWNPGTDSMKDWKVATQSLGGGLQHGDWGYYATLLESTGFVPAKKLPERHELDDDVLECADMCLPYYEKMYRL